jgi:hypothetical protein
MHIAALLMLIFMANQTLCLRLLSPHADSDLPLLMLMSYQLFCVSSHVQAILMSKQLPYSYTNASKRCITLLTWQLLQVTVCML